jgi:hypothetical protein
VFELSPNDGFVQISWPLILILAIITHLVIRIQGQAIDDLRKTHDALGEADKDRLIIELRLQMLLDRVQRICKEVEDTESGFALAASLNGLEIVGGKLQHPGLHQLCAWAHAHLGDAAQREALRIALYKRALRLRLPSLVGAERMYDVLYTEEAPPGIEELNYHSVIKNDEASVKAREFAMQLLEERLARWHERVETMQWEMIIMLFERDAIPEDLIDKNPAVTCSNIARYLAQCGFPLLPAVFSGVAEQLKSEIAERSAEAGK